MNLFSFPGWSFYVKSLLIQQSHQTYVSGSDLQLSPDDLNVPMETKHANRTISFSISVNELINFSKVSHLSLLLIVSQKLN